MSVPLVRIVEIANRHPRLRFRPAAIRQLIATLDAHQQEITRGNAVMPEGELSVVFMTDPALAKLHGDFLNDPSPTDVITFDGNPLLGTAGEICVSADTAAAYAKARGDDFNAELTLYVVHGWLHLAGFDDLVPAKKRAMRRAEARAMRRLAAANSIPAFALQQNSKKLSRSCRKKR